MSDLKIETDVLVIGGGGAGFRAAIAARECSVKVTLVSKGPIARCGATPMAGADYTLNGKNLYNLGYNGDPHDSEEKVFNDIVTQGFFLNNQKLVEQYIANAPARLKEMIDWGMKIRSSEERAIYTTGINIMDVLLKKAQSIGVEMIEDVMVVDLFTRNGKIAGALGIDIKTGEFIQFVSRAVVIASGGWHKAFWPNTGMRDLSGDGIAMALRAGAEIGGMEFITFVCNAFYEPPMWRGSIAPYIMSLICGGELTNSSREKILEKYDPYLVKYGNTTEWNKCFVSYISAREVRDGHGSPNGGVYYGRGDEPWERFERNALKFFPDWQYKSLNLREFGRMLKENEPVEVGPAAEYFDGGIVVNERFETAIDGLYAAGECTLGPFGANRVFSAITEMLVHGADAGNNAAAYVKEAEISGCSEDFILQLKKKTEQPLIRKTGAQPAQVRRRVQETAHKYLGPIRTGKELQIFVEFLDNTREDELPEIAVSSKNRIYNKEWIDAIELENIITLLTAAAKSALLRTESRGVHFREDFPKTDNDFWMYETIVKICDGELEITKRPVTITKKIPAPGSARYLDMMKRMMELRSDTGGGH